MSKKLKFNAIIVRQKTGKGLVFISFQNGVLDSNCYPLTLQDDFLPEEQVKGALPKNKIILADVDFKSDTDLSICPKYSVDIKMKGRKINFWNVVDNQEYISYFLGNLKH